MTRSFSLARSALIAASAVLAAPATIAADFALERRNVVDLAASKDAVYAVHGDWSLWRKDAASEDRWKRLNGRFARISIGPKGGVWGVGADGVVVRQVSGGGFRQTGRLLARDVAAVSEKEAYATSFDGLIYHWSESSPSWKRVGGPAIRITAASDGALWGVDQAGRLRRVEGASWRVVDEKHVHYDLARGADGEMVSFSDAGRVSRWSASGSAAGAMETGAPTRQAAISPDGRIWRLGADGALSATAFSSRAAADGGQAPVEQASAEDLSGLTASDFQHIDFTASAISIGADGRVFVLDPAGQLHLFSSRRRAFFDFPGVLSVVKAAPGGRIWGVTRERAVVFHDGEKWNSTKGADAKDVSVGADGRVLAVVGDGEIREFEPRSETFMATRLTGETVDIAPDGAVWTLRDGAAYRCEGARCARMPGAGFLDLDIGPDGSVFAITASKRLAYWDAKAEKWIEVRDNNSERVAVGPGGHPWVTAGAKGVFASRLFERNEAQDLLTATKTVRVLSNPAVAASNDSASAVFGADAQAVATTNTSSIAGAIASAGSVIQTPEGVLQLSGAGSARHTHDTALEPGSGSLTVELWFNWSGTPPTSLIDALVSKGNHENSSDPGYAMYLSQSGDLEIRSATTTNGRGVLGVSMSARAPGWYHVAMVIDQSTATGQIRGYLNGEASFAPFTGYATTWPSAIITAPIEPFVIGGADLSGSPQGGASGFSGRIDEVSVWRRALTQTEIRANFESAAAPSGAGLSAHWTFNTIEDAQPKDVSGNGRDLTLLGDAKLESGTAVKDASAAP